MVIRIFIIDGVKYEVMRSNRKNKKFKVKVGNKFIHFGAKGYSISPRTLKGDRYCARSYGIKGVNNITSANFWSRMMWDCDGKRSKR